MSVNKLDTLEVSETPENIGFSIGQVDADSIQKQILQLAEFRETERTCRAAAIYRNCLLRPTTQIPANMPDFPLFVR